MMANLLEGAPMYMYVATSGNDSNPGTEVSPFLNIKHGVSKLSAGDTLYVKTGTYDETILSWKTPIANGTSWNDPVTVAAYPGDTVTVRPTGGQVFFWVADRQAKYLIIDGFIVDGQNKALHGFKFSENSRYIRVKNTEIKNTIDHAILVSVCSGCANPETEPHDTFHEFINLKVHDIGDEPFVDHGFYIHTSHNLVKNSDFYNNPRNGVKIYHGNLSGVSNYNIARNN